MLIYDPTLDPYHCAIRILAISENASISHLPLDSVRIAVFYLAYPSKVAEIRLPSNLVKIRKCARVLATPYRNPFDVKASFERMYPIFHAAVLTLAAAGYIDSDRMRQGVIQRTDKAFPADLSNVLQEFMGREREIREFIARELTAIPLRGVDGLKHRSGLLEHRYDPS